MKKRKLILFFLTATLVLLTANLMGNWWSNRDNNLFNNGRWIIGKDTGKYLFYTYQFMFDPLKKNMVKLNSRMGFQEILYHEPETDDNRLKKLTFDMVVGGGTYIWVPLRKEGQRAFTCRFSYRKNYPSGFFTFNNQGEMIEYIPFPDGMPSIQRSTKQSVELELVKDQWVVKIDGKQIGSAQDPEFKNGYFGFRGSGVLRQRNNIESISIQWLNKGRLFTEYENFGVPATTQKQWQYILLCALLVVLLRLVRNWSLGSCLSFPGANHYISIDLIFASLLLGIITQVSGLTDVAQLGLSLLLLEFFSFVAFAWFIRKYGLNKKIPRTGVIVFVSVTCIIATLSLYRHGEWAGRKQYSPETIATKSHPKAFIQSPVPILSVTDITKSKAFSVSFGKPFTTGENAFNEQEVAIDFTMPIDTTFDISLQQQSFFTKGDPQGESLPLRRRLVRLSTVKHVASGVATQTGRQPGSFLPLQGDLLAGQLNSLSIRSTEKGLLVILNGQKTALMPSVAPLGYGETMLMTYERPVLIHRLDIHSFSTPASGRHSWLLIGAFGFPFIALIGGLFFRLMGGTTPTLACLGTVATTFPIFAYFTIILFVEPIRLTLMSVDRLTLLDFALAASAWSLLYWIPLHHQRIKQMAILANVFFTVHIATVIFLIWDVFLPVEHPFKTYFSPTHVKPGELVVNSEQAEVPWYAIDKRIGGNSFVWKQQFEGRWVSLAKKPGRIRAFVLGGSQAWGSGAGSTRDTFSGLLHQRCQESGLPVEVFNAGANGAGVATIYDIFFGILIKYNPDLIIVDMGLNDSAGLKGRKNIKRQLLFFQEIAQACSVRGIDLILVQEPMSQESPLTPNKALYAANAEIARKFNFQVVDVRPRLAQADSMEMTWWDTAHLAPRGHIIMADTIYPALKKTIEKRLVKSVNSGTAKDNVE